MLTYPVNITIVGVVLAVYAWTKIYFVKMNQQQRNLFLTKLTHSKVPETNRNNGFASLSALSPEDEPTQ